MATKKRASVYMLRVTNGGECDDSAFSAGEWVRIMDTSPMVFSSADPGDATPWTLRAQTRWAREKMRKAGVSTEIVRFVEVPK